MIAAFISGAAGNTSTLIGFSFAAQYKEIFVSALSAGFGLSGLVPSVFNFVQDTGANLVRFPPISNSLSSHTSYANIRTDSYANSISISNSPKRRALVPPCGSSLVPS